MRIVTFLAAALIVSPVMAQDAAPAEDPSIAMLCKKLADYTPPKGVDYVPGAEDVVPADVGGAHQVTPDVIEIPVTVLLAERFPTVDIPLNDVQLEPDVGIIEVHSDGEVTYRGLNVTSDAQYVCGGGESPDGQEAAEPLKSEPEEQEPQTEQPAEPDE